MLQALLLPLQLEILQHTFSKLVHPGDDEYPGDDEDEQLHRLDAHRFLGGQGAGSHLRKTEYRALGVEEGTGEKLRWRTPVRKHFKRQPYGPGRKLRKIIVIMPYWRGPEDAPVRHVERIWQVDR